MKKILGYILAVIGLIGVAIWAIPQLGTAFQTFYQNASGSEDATFNLTIILIAGAALAVLGLLIIMKGGRGRSRQAPEVPIYRGKEIVGYRRH
jgi:hypothetical protein